MTKEQSLAQLDLLTLAALVPDCKHDVNILGLKADSFVKIIQDASKVMDDMGAELERVKKELGEYIRHGNWIDSDKYKGYLTCSECHDCYVEKEWIGTKWKYCPNCGAKMDGRKNVPRNDDD